MEAASTGPWEKAKRKPDPEADADAASDVNKVKADIWRRLGETCPTFPRLSGCETPSTHTEPSIQYPLAPVAGGQNMEAIIS